MATQSIEWPQEPVSIYWTPSDLPDKEATPPQFVIFDEDEGGDGFSAGLYDIEIGNQVIKRFLEQASYQDLDSGLSLSAGDLWQALKTTPRPDGTYRWSHDPLNENISDMTKPEGEENFIVWKVDPDLRPFGNSAARAGKLGVCSCGVPACETQYALFQGNVCQILFNIIGGELRSVIFFPFCLEKMGETA